MGRVDSSVQGLRWGASLEALLVWSCVLVAILTVGCSKKQSSEGAGDDTPATKPDARPVNATSASKVTGTVKFTGTPPAMKAISMAAVPNCAKRHDSPAMTETVVLGDNGALQNVVVYLKGDFSQYSFPPATTPVKIDQSGCVYAPHVVALRTHEALQVTNSDTVTHNVDAVSSHGQGWNLGLPPGSEPIERSFAREEIAVPVKCNIHPWMKFYVAVLSHPYFQVTGKDGSFVLKDVPPGAYTLTAWHERYGTQEQAIVTQPHSEQNISITFTNQDHP